MLGRVAGVVAASCALTTAFLLPPDVNVADGDETSLFGLDPDYSSKDQILHIPCPACAFATKDTHTEESEDEVFRTSGGANTLLLNFGISSDGERLELNGKPIYPPQYHIDAFVKGQLVAVQQVSASGEDIDVPLEVTSSGLIVDDKQHVGEAGELLTPMKYRILGLEKQLMDLQEINVALLKTEHGLLLLRVNAEEIEPV